MMRRRFRRRRSHWIWADRFSFVLNNAATNFGGKFFALNQLLPPGRVEWFCNSVVSRSHVTVTGVLMWLDFWWQTSTANQAVLLPDVDLFVMKTQEDEVGSEAFAFDPFVQPEPPALVTTWGTSPADGLDAFLWSHHIRGSTPPNAVVGTYIASDNVAYNQEVVIRAAADSNVNTCRTFRVAAEWQPDVHIKTKRRLQRSEGLVIGMLGLDTAFPTGTQAFLTVNTRIVAR